MAIPSFAEGVITCSISTCSLRVGAYTASDNALRGRGSGHARLELHRYIITEVADSNSSYLLLCTYVCAMASMENMSSGNVDRNTACVSNCDHYYNYMAYI